jgi:ankyrin repeat protein
MTEDEMWKIVESDNPINEQMIFEISVLIKSGFDPFKIDLDREMNLFQEASLRGKTEIVRLILTPPDDMIGFDVCSFFDNIKERIDAKSGPDGRTALHNAIEEGNLEIVKMLVNAGAKIDIPDNQRNTPLHISAFNNKIEIMEFLLAQQHLVNSEFLDAVESDGSTALHYATNEGYFEIVKMLVNAGANIDIPDNQKNTPLHISAFNNKIEIMEFLIAKQLQVNPESLNAKGEDYGWTALHHASIMGNFENGKMLVMAGASIDIPDNDGNTPLHLAAYHNRIEIVEFLIAVQLQVNPKSLNTKGENGCTALHCASEQGNLEIVKMLVKAGASSDIPDNEGNTSLHLAAIKNKNSIVEFLIAVPLQFHLE